MSSTIRLDKWLSQSGEYSRKEATALIKKGLVCVNDQIARDGNQKISPDAVVTLSGKMVTSDPYQYYVLNKPAGVVTATTDARDQTVMDLMPPALLKRDVLPVGRLDKDTTGLLLFTNHGALAHRLLSPRHHVWKVYEATVTGALSPLAVTAFQNGIVFSDFVSKPAKLDILSVSDDQSIARVHLQEGKFHQVKRMFHAIGHEVTALHRLSFGSLHLPPDLHLGEHRALTAKEVAALMNPSETQEE